MHKKFIPAFLGGPPSIPNYLQPFDTIDEREMQGADHVFATSNNPLSGYLGGVYQGGRYVERLEKEWCEAFHCKHAVACNSATSGLLMAAAAVDLRQGDEFIVSPFTMSATVAAPAFTGAIPIFCDVEPLQFCLNPSEVDKVVGRCRAIIVTNLFGQPAELTTLRKVADAHNIFLIEDNAQSPFAMEGKQFAGTIGHIGVFSLNVHKHLQCGEGGICVTDNNILADRMREFRNHGEMFQDGRIGLNLRMTEVTAAIASVQLAKASKIIPNRIEQANLFQSSMEDIPGITMAKARKECVHVYYTVPMLFDSKVVGCTREKFLKALAPEFMHYQKHKLPTPIGYGYVKPLYHLPAFQKFAADCPVAEDLHNNSLLYFENCSWSPSPKQMGQMGYAFRKVVEAAQAGAMNE